MQTSTVAQKVNLYMASERLQPDSNSGRGGGATGGKKKPEDEFWTDPLIPLSLSVISYFDNKYKEMYRSEF